MEPQFTPTKPRRRRRLGRRILAVCGYVVAAFVVAWFFESRLPTTVIFVRHADTDIPIAEGTDPSLNANGRVRAEALADFMQNIDVISSVNAIYVDDTQRTRQTAAPLAKRLGLETLNEDPYKVGHFMREVLRENTGQIVLIVAPADAIAPLIDELHGSKRLPTFAADEYDDVYIVTIPRYSKVKTLRLHYGAPHAVSQVSGVAAPTLTSPR